MLNKAGSFALEEIQSGEEELASSLYGFRTK
jgi:hypothetical protein